MWEKIGLKSEPFLSIEPLSTKDDFAYFVNRDKEFSEISSYLESTNPFNLLISGKAGIGKTTLINRILLDFPISLRVDLSQIEEHQAIIDRITLEVAKFTMKLGVKSAESIEKQLIYESRMIKSTSKKISGKLPFFETGIERKKGGEQLSRVSLISRETMIEEMLDNINRPIIIFLDDADHLPLNLQANILESCEPIFVSKKCISIFATRKETGELFAKEPDSVYRARFMDFVELKDIVMRQHQSVHSLLLPRFNKVVLDSFIYPFSQEVEVFLASVCNSNIRELLRYSAIILRQSILQNVPVPIKVEFAMATLASKNYLIGEIDEESYLVLKVLKNQPMSASNTDFQKATALARATLSKTCNRLFENNLLNKTISKNKVFYSISPKGEHILNMYVTLRR